MGDTQLTLIRDVFTGLNKRNRSNQMKSIEDHIEHDKKIADDPQANPAARRHAKEELHELEEYVEHHKEEIEAGDHHDPNALELFCDNILMNLSV